MMLKLFVSALVLIQTVLAANDQCSKGPSFWCSSLQNAKECGAFRHCIQTVWTTHTRYTSELTGIQQLLKTEQPNPCSNCMQCVQTSQSLHTCPLIHEFEDEIKDLTSQKLPASQICMLLQQCDSTDTDAEKVEDTTLELELSDIKCDLKRRNWCANLESARKCDAVNYCINEWTRSPFGYRMKQMGVEQTAKQSGELMLAQKTCSFCMFVFKTLSSSLENDPTFNAQNYLTSSCRLLPSKSDVAECEQIVGMNFQAIMNMLANKVDNGLICKVMGSCQSKHLEAFDKKKEAQTKPFTWDQVKIKIINEDEAVVNVKKPATAKKQKLLGHKGETLVPQLAATHGVACEACTIVFNAAKFMLENKVEQEMILNFVNKELCSRLGKYNDTCSTYITLDGDMIFEMLDKSVNPAVICRSMGLCTNAQVSRQPNAIQFYDLEVRNQLNCTLCKMVVEKVKHQLSDHKSQAEIIDYINGNLCDRIGKSKEICHTLIDAYGPLFLNIIAQDVNPEQVCDMLGMCEKPTAPFKPVHIHLETDDGMEPQETALDIKEDAKCILCEFAIAELKKYISQNSTEAQIQKELQQVCMRLPRNIRLQCNTLITIYGHLIIDSLINGVTPDQVCMEIGLCSKQIEDDVLDSGVPMLLIEPAQEMPQPVHSEIPCGICEFIVQYLDNHFDVDSTEQMVEFTVNNACKLIPSRFKVKCQSLMNKYGERLVEFMRTTTDPLKVCRSAKLCHTDAPSKALVDIPIESDESSEEAVPMQAIKPAHKLDKHYLPRPKYNFGEPVQTSKNNSLACSLCVYAAEMVDNALKQNKTEEQILLELKLICNLFPTNYKDQCNGFMNEYGPYVLQLIASDLDPEETCVALRMCEKAIVKGKDRFDLRND